MDKRMDWKKLLSSKRVSDYIDNCATKKKSQFKDPRSPFERDYDQLIYCYPFRRLQDKTQVIPFPKYDFVHTRLTHSLEVASVGRSLGKMASELIFAEKGADFFAKNNLCKSDIGTLVASACLAHDIGNPPFGHSGEDSISYFFKEREDDIKPIDLFSDEFSTSEDGENLYYTQNYPTKRRIFVDPKEIITYTKMWSDLSNFEGNANGFRILTANCVRGINPTTALLGTFTKYPRESWLLNDPYRHLNKKERPKSQAKYGFFQEQKELFKTIANELGLIAIDCKENENKLLNQASDDVAYRRHPLTFLMEAADDIAYQMIDFEDGCRLKLIDLEKNYPKVNGKSPYQLLTEIAKLDNSYDETRVEDLKGTTSILSLLRAKVINVLTQYCFKVFVDNYENIMTGKFDKSLIDCIDEKIITNNLKDMNILVKEYIYNYDSVLESEISGFEVMNVLIEGFSSSCSICFSCNEQETPKQKKLRNLLPEEFRPSEEEINGNLSFEEKYIRFLKIIDYVSGMTDNYAASLYRKVKGITLPRR